MPSLKETKRRIGSVKNTQKITRAMKLVSAAKFARANQAVIASRPYSKAFQKMLATLLAAGSEAESQWYGDRPEKSALLIIVSSDRGLCGSLNTNLFKQCAVWLEQKKTAGVKVETWAWGRRAQLFMRRRKEKVSDIREKLTDKPTQEGTLAVASQVIEAYQNGGFDHIYLAFAEFKSAMLQLPKIAQLLPFEKLPETGSKVASLIVEPSQEVLMETIFKRGVGAILFRAFLESAASEHGARMSAMDSATNNAKEVIRKLTLQYNRARQAAITKELIEIISGAEAL